MTTEHSQVSQSSQATDDAEAPATGVDSILAAPLSPTPLTLDAANPVQFEVLSRLKQLEESLLARDPMMKMHLGAIHKELISHEELVHLLSNEQIATIVGAQQLHTNVVLASELSTKAGKTKAANRTASLGLGDL